MQGSATFLVCIQHCGVSLCSWCFTDSYSSLTGLLDNCYTKSFTRVPSESSSILESLPNVHSLSLDSSKSNSRAKASAGLFLQAGCKCCHRAYPISRSNEGWVGKPGYSVVCSLLQRWWPDILCNIHCRVSSVISCCYQYIILRNESELRAVFIDGNPFVLSSFPHYLSI